MSWGIYARADHPPGYGYPPHPGETGGRAHGYVLLAVDCGADTVPSYLRTVPFGNLAYKDEVISMRDHVSCWHDIWYGGDFDLVLTVESQPVIEPDWGNQHYRSIGDNRAVLVTSLVALRECGVKP